MTTQEGTEGMSEKRKYTFRDYAMLVWGLLYLAGPVCAFAGGLLHIWGVWPEISQKVLLTGVVIFGAAIFSSGWFCPDDEPETPGEQS